MMSDSSTNPDPEWRRITELADAIDQGEASEAQREELMLHVESRPEAIQYLQHRLSQEEGRSWLARVEADTKLQQAENSPWSRSERKVGLALLGGGFALSFLIPVLGAPAMLLGSGLLLWSAIRVRLSTHQNDPYKDIRQ